MDVAIVLAVSVLLQFAAAFVALRLIWLTGVGRAWVPIAAAIFLMAVRRSITLVELIARGFSEPPSLPAELVALVISLLMVAGMAWIVPLFLSISRSERESEQRFRSLVETTSDWIWAVDQNDVYTYASPKVKDLTGYEPDEVLGKTPSDFMPPEEGQLKADLFRRFAAEGKPFVRVENTICHTDGRRVILERSGVPIFDDAGNLCGYRGVDRDITKPKEDEARLKRTLAELERSNRDLQQFAYSASHDLQEPLRMVNSFLETLQQRSRDTLDENAAELVKLSLRTVGRMQQLIDGLLAYARVGTRGKRFERLDCNAVVDQVIGDLQATIEASGARVTHDELPSLGADPMLMSQLFQNLIGNAVKFHGPDPPRVHVASQRVADAWQFAVVDNGIGVDTSAAERIFEVFERLHPAEQYAGTGIGLAICKRVVERHGGRIWCEPQPQRGSTFYFTIPDAAATATKEPAESP